MVKLVRLIMCRLSWEHWSCRNDLLLANRFSHQSTFVCWVRVWHSGLVH